MPIVGKIIKSLREERGWVQQELADRVGMARTSIVERERGDTRIKHPERKKFADAFDLSIAQFNDLCDKAVATNQTPVVKDPELTKRLEEAFKILESAGQSELAISQIELLAETFMISTDQMKMAISKSKGADQS